MSDLVENPEERFCHGAAQLLYRFSGTSGAVLRDFCLTWDYYDTTILCIESGRTPSCLSVFLSVFLSAFLLIKCVALCQR